MSFSCFDLLLFVYLVEEEGVMHTEFGGQCFKRDGVVIDDSEDEESDEDDGN